MDRTRDRRIQFIKRRLLRRGLPRLQVFLIIVVTGTTGFLTSFCLLHAGLGRMWVRYPAAILVAYCIFLLLLRLWLWLNGRKFRGDLNPPDGLPDIFPTGHAGPAEAMAFGGGNTGGGGTGGSWGEGMAVGNSPSPPVSSGGSSAGDFDLDFGEGCLIVVAILALAGGLVASLYIVYIAPALLAEILVDGVLLAGLYRRMKRIEQRHWLRAAARQTIVPALLAVLFFSIAGYAMQAAVPEARSIGDVWKHMNGPRR